MSSTKNSGSKSKKENKSKSKKGNVNDPSGSGSNSGTNGGNGNEYNLVNGSDPNVAGISSSSSSLSSTKELNDDQYLRSLYVEERKNERMVSLEHENETLKTIAKELRLRLDKHVQSQTQIIQHLKAKVKKRDKRINELLKMEKELQEKSELMNQKYLAEKEEIEERFKFRIEELEGKIQVLEAQYREIKHFEANKSQLEHDLKTLEEQLDEEKLQHNLHVR
jgi:hypothetical protein